MFNSKNDNACKAVQSTTWGNYNAGSGRSLHVYLSDKVLGEAQISLGQRLKPEVVMVEIGKENRRKVVGLSIKRSATGPTLRKHQGRYLVQASNRCRAVFASTPMVAVEVKLGSIVLIPAEAANDNVAIDPKDCVKTVRVKGSPKLALPVPFVPSMLESLSIDPGWKRRNAMLAGNDNVRTTSAGDLCFTGRYIVDAVLRAANRNEFDIDVCSMQKDGRYDKSVKVTGRSWGSTPQQFRHDKFVVKHVPSKRYFTNDRPYGSLARIWDGDFIWLNPPYSLRAWATFLEYAHLQVEADNAGIIVALVPCDNNGPHNRHFYGEHAYRIEITRQIPFFKREKRDRDGNVKPSDTIDVIRGNQFVVFGKGPKVKTFLSRFLRELKKIDYITEQHEARYISMFGLDGGRGSRKTAA